MKNSLIVCASIAYMEDRVRLNKLKEVFDNNNTEFIFWGWKRGNSQYSTDYKVKHLWAGGGFSSKKLFIHYPLWIIMVFFNAFKISKNDLVYAVSLDVALPIYLVSYIKGYKYIFDNPDNFSLTYNLKGFGKKVIDLIEKKVARKALYHILPDASRIEYRYKNTVILPNFPLDSEIKKAQNIYKDNSLDGFDLNIIKKDSRLKIYINGRMVKHRGSEWIADSLKNLNADKFLIIVAGNIYCNKLENTLNSLDNVIKFPRLENYKALSLYYVADIVFAFYDPVLPINRKASANKWWDCVVCKTPFISNKEVETLETFNKEGACFLIEYNSEKLVDLLNELEDNREKLNEVKKNMEKLNTYSWGSKIDQLIQIKKGNI